MDRSSLVPFNHLLGKATINEWGQWRTNAIQEGIKNTLINSRKFYIHFLETLFSRKNTPPPTPPSAEITQTVTVSLSITEPSIHHWQIHSWDNRFLSTETSPESQKLHSAVTTYKQLKDEASTHERYIALIEVKGCCLNYLIKKSVAKSKRYNSITQLKSYVDSEIDVLTELLKNGINTASTIK